MTITTADKLKETTMTIDPKAIEAAWNLYRAGPHNIERFQESFAAYLADLPPVDVAGLTREARETYLSMDERSVVRDLLLDLATALERIARERDEAQQEARTAWDMCELRKAETKAAQARIAAPGGGEKRRRKAAKPSQAYTSQQLDDRIDKICGCKGQYDCDCASVFNQAERELWWEYNTGTPAPPQEASRD